MHDDHYFMSMALELAKLSDPAPNPPVGAVVVKGQHVVGVGYHLRAGASHAEALALAQAGALAEGATLYVTLEPCNHYGRTPPCSLAVLRARIARVVVGCRDPNYWVRGGGAVWLRASGVEVELGCREAAAEQLIEAWRRTLNCARHSA